MKEIVDYLIQEKNQTAVVAKVLAKNLVKYDDIKEGFIWWLKTREYSEKPVVNGYNAVSIHEMQPDLDAAGVYQFLVTLRDEPEKAKEYIKSNFARK